MLTIADLERAIAQMRDAPLRRDPFPNPVHPNEKAHLQSHDGLRLGCLRCAIIFSKAAG